MGRATVRSSIERDLLGEVSEMSDTAAIVFLVGRILFAAYFAMAAMGHFTRGGMMVGYARARGFALAGVSSWPAGIWLVLGVVSIVFGIWPEIGALLLAGFPIVTALGVHTFWKDADPQQRVTEMQNHVRNWTFVGAGLGLFAVFASLGDRVPYALVPPLIRF
jgi:uncharacterized membrane protein YphA (DoxX/SURF4 family)